MLQRDEEVKEASCPVRKEKYKKMCCVGSGERWYVQYVKTMGW